MKRLIGCIVGTVLLAASVGGCFTPSDLRLNQVQVLGTHNSYHVEPDPQKLEFMLQFDPKAIELAYTHPPIDQQLAGGIRQIELDISPDPTGDLWAPTGRPGFKVFHIEQIDMDSTCAVLVDCLRIVKAWSEANSDHVPIAVLLEIKDGVDVPGAPDPLPMTPALYDALDAEIRSVFPPDRLLTPDRIRGGHATLEQAVLTDGWPRLDDVRGTVMVLLDNKRDQYVAGHPSLQGRVAFTPSSPGQPDAAFVKVNEPRGNVERIQDLVRRGYVVRTRADTPVLTARSGDVTQRDAALASGAQWVSTDYPQPGMSARWGTDYVARIPQGSPGRCNPVNSPSGCEAGNVELNTPANP